MRGFTTASGEAAVTQRSRIHTMPVAFLLIAWAVIELGCWMIESTVVRKVALVLGLAGVLYLVHPPPKVAWFDTPLVAHEFNARGWVGGLAWYRDYHNYRRPVRAIEWDLMAHAFGEEPRAYHAVNALCVASSASLLFHLLGPVSAISWLLSYVTIYPLLHFPIALNFALGLGGLALIMLGHGPIKGSRSPWLPTVLGVLLVWAGALGHEVFLVFAVLPYLYSGWVRALPQGGIWGAMLALPLWWLTRGAGGGWSYDASVLEHVGRVAFSILSLGAAPEILREVGWPEPYARVRDIYLNSFQGQMIVAMLILAPVVCTASALMVWRWSGRLKFRVAWAALASLPLLLPVGTPESYHLIGAVAPMAAICESGWRRAKWLIVLVPLIAVPHLAARWQLFYRDLPVMSEIVRDVRSRRIEMLINVPVQIGGHYAFFPRIPERICFSDGAAFLGREDQWWPASKLSSHPTGGSIPLCR